MLTMPIYNVTVINHCNQSAVQPETVLNLELFSLHFLLLSPRKSKAFSFFSRKIINFNGL